MSVDFDTIVNLSKKRGFVFQSSEIYGGLRSAYDYGPLGVALLRNVKEQWWKSMVRMRDDVVGIDSAIIQSPRVWEASGHVSSFSDPLVECTNCNTRHRLDKLEDPDQCPACGTRDTFTEAKDFNLMFETHMGPVHTDDNKVYLRPETAQGIFINFENVRRTSRLKLPFGIAQIGKSFRNEITPGQFVFRTREFEQMEMEFFCEPSESQKWFEYWLAEREQWYRDLGMSPENLRLREHESDELSHYAAGTYDVEFKFPWGWDELEGIANRTDYDLKAHAENSGEDLRYYDQEANERFYPHVIEPAAGATRTTFAFPAGCVHLRDRRGGGTCRAQARQASGAHRRGGPAAVEEARSRRDDPEGRRSDPRGLRHRGRRDPVDRPSLPPSGRDRHAFLCHDRLRHPGRRPGHGPRPRHNGPRPHPHRLPPRIPGRPVLTPCRSPHVGGRYRRR